MIDINGKTKIIGIIGNPVEHTLSPAMHNAAFQALKINAVYVPLLVFPESLGSAVESIRSLNFTGFNVTVPHKENVMRYLDDIDPLAKKIGAVNTVVSHYGKLTGYNTDATGFIKSLKGKFDIKNKSVLVLGAGGAGKAIIFALIKNGASCVYVYDVKKEKARSVCPATRDCFPGISRSVCKNTVEARDLKKIIEKVKMIVNATPAGIREGRPPVNTGYLRRDMFIYDIVYNRETELIKEAKRKKIPHLSGIEMLLYQGVDAFELWTNKKAPVDIMRRILLRNVANAVNVEQDSVLRAQSLAK